MDIWFGECMVDKIQDEYDFIFDWRSCFEFEILRRLLEASGETLLGVFIPGPAWIYVEVSRFDLFE